MTKMEQSPLSKLEPRSALRIRGFRYRAHAINGLILSEIQDNSLGPAVEALTSLCFLTNLKYCHSLHFTVIEITMRCDGGHDTLFQTGVYLGWEDAMTVVVIVAMALIVLLIAAGVAAS
jgi:hypothetical protein